MPKAIAAFDVKISLRLFDNLMQGVFSDWC